MKAVKRIRAGNRYNHGARRPCFMIVGTIVPLWMFANMAGACFWHAPALIILREDLLDGCFLSRSNSGERGGYIRTSNDIDNTLPFSSVESVSYTHLRA